MITYKEAQGLLQENRQSYGVETVALEAAFGRTLAEHQYADRDYPPFNRAAMDGYALPIEAFKAGVRSFRVQETIWAGRSFSADLDAESCFRIMTGAAVPSGANVVVRKEDCEEESGAVRILLDALKPGQHIAEKGEDARRGQRVLKAPAICSPAVMSLLATLGCTRVPVLRLPRVALITTGDEVVESGRPVAGPLIRNSNVWMVRALLQTEGIEPDFVAHAPDDPCALRTVFRQALEYDLVITCGGVSAGAADFVPRIWEELGVEALFYKVAIKPGKPVWCGRMPGGAQVFSLPGNPFSCLVTFKLFVGYFLGICRGGEGGFRKGTLAAGRRKKGALEEYFPAVLGPDGVMPLPVAGSGAIAAALNAELIARHPAAQMDLRVGEYLDYIPL
ncbi:MAG TPA: molybdopterin molybdotransferase MoeA [Chitinophagaceae bacterium]|jgi:molybdopterin molybdotransferase|nr:molybdopterin molybdotransferase MoeA [Chitinophagaceae bacterium]